MAKIGIEVEGKHTGEQLRTLFCSADEYVNRSDLMEVLVESGAQHIYISDHDNDLDLEALAEKFSISDIMVTVELTELFALPPDGIEIFWNVSKAHTYEQSKTVLFLRPSDQVKVEQGQHVIAWEVGEGYFTLPEDFIGDVEV